MNFQRPDPRVGWYSSVRDTLPACATQPIFWHKRGPGGGGAGGGLDSYLRDLREALEGPRTLAPMAGNLEHTDDERDAPPIYRLPHRASTCSGRGLFTRVRGVQPSVLNRCTVPIGGYLRSRFTPFIWYKLTPYGVGSKHSRFVRSLVVRTWFSGAKGGGFS
jgi:hypothetical protein